MRRLLGAIFLVAMPGLCAAQDVDCANATTQSAMNGCAYADWEAYDAELNAVWPDAMAVMKAIDADLPATEQGAANLLRAGQKAWIAFRDATCAAEAYMMKGGSAEPLVLYGCMARLTEQRSLDLHALVEVVY